MSNSDKNIVITPNIGSSTDDPQIVFTGANVSTSSSITAKITPDNNGTLVFSGISGDILTISDSATKKLIANGNIRIAGAIYDSSDSSGVSGYQLTSTGTGIAWENWQAEVTDVYYVAKNGLDTNNGKSLSKPFLTIKAACDTVAPLIAADPTRRISIYVKAGNYIENNPVTVPARVGIIGDSLRTVSVRPGNTALDTFYVNNACYVTGITFRGHLSPCAAIAYNPDGSAGNVTTSPYIQNCSSITTTGCGIRIDGNYAGGTKGMVMDSYTQFNQGGKGVHILNNGYAQLVSVFTVCATIGVHCESGGQCSVANSNNAFGDYGLVADGVTNAKDSGTSSTVNLSTNQILLTGLSNRPPVNDVVRFTGYSEYYTIEYTTPLVGGQTTVTFLEAIPNIPPGTAFQTFRRSLISASGQTMEYVGSGTILATALPDNGGIPDPEKEVVSLNGGKVFFTSTDQKGNFKVGSGFTIESATGTVTGRTFNQSLFSVMTPYILAIT